MKSRTFRLRDSVESFTEFHDILASVWPNTQTENNPTTSRNSSYGNDTEMCVKCDPENHDDDKTQVSTKNTSHTPGINITGNTSNTDVSNQLKTGIPTEIYASQRNAKSGEISREAGIEPKLSVEIRDTDPHIHSNETRTSSGICMIGLHCCGPLTPAMLHLFCTKPKLKSLVCLSCCYHGMTVQGK